MTGSRRAPADLDVRSKAARSLGDCYLLEAGAGTGKTTVLMDRVEEILKTEVALDRIAIITFTEKAAGELKLRLRQRIEKTLAGADPESGWGVHLRRSLEALDRATVSTIHSFAASLLRERPVEANVDPRFSVADQLAAAMLAEETWERWIESELSDGAPALARALRLGVTLEQIRALAFALAENRDVSLPPAPPPARDALAEARDRIVEGIGRLADRAASCVAADEALAQIRALQAAAPALRAASGDRLLLRLEALPLKATAGAQRNWKPAAILAEVKRIVGELAAAREQAARSERTAAAHDLAVWIRDGFLHACRVAKESRRLLDFADLLIVCRDMLRASRPARAAFQARFDCLLVDEFQDTDPLQSEILFLLAADDPGVDDWRRAKPKPGKLFVVGDPKQSIYRFRRADIEVYDEARALIRAAGGVTDRGLRQNFRTVPSIVSWVNDLFGNLIQPSPGTRWQPAYEAIEAWREEPVAGASRVSLLMPPAAAGLAEADAATVRAAEARHVVALARQAVEEKWPVQAEGLPDARPMRWGDIALLFRTSAALEAYEDVLREHAVPYRIAGGKRYYLRAEMRALQAVLAAVESPHDPLAVVSALRCPFFGHSDEDLLTYRAAGGDWVYTREGAGRGTAFEKAFELLARLHAARHRRSVAATLEDIYESTGALALFYLKPDGDQRAANLLKAIDLARAHEAAGGATFGSFVRWLAGMATEERDEGEAPLTEESGADAAGDDADAVRLSTVHKAKGLEFPMVILCDPAGAGASALPVCVVERGEDGARLEFCAGSGAQRLESSGYTAAAEREKERLKAEGLRLFYVAATRARDYLVVPAFGGKRAGGVYAALRETGFLPDGAGGGMHRGAALLDGATLATAPRRVEPFRLSAAEAVPSDPGLIAEKAGWRKALDLALRAPTMGREFRSASGLETPPAPREGGAGAPAARRRSRAIGVAVHAVLERIDLAAGRDIGVLSEEEATDAGFPEAAGEVRALVSRALQGRIVREALAAPRRFRELPFAAAGDSWITEGRIDLVFESGGALTIVDFKTDDVATEAEIAARMTAYEPQALIYARALAQTTGLPVARVVFFFIRPGAERTVKVDEAFLARGRRLLETGAVVESGRGRDVESPSP